MRILFDNATPAGLARLLAPHVVTRAYAMRWHELRNGDLLAAAERAGFECFVTPDKNLRYQQNLSARRIAIVVLPTPRWPDVERNAGAVRDAVERAGTNSFCEVVFDL